MLAISRRAIPERAMTLVATSSNGGSIRSESCWKGKACCSPSSNAVPEPKWLRTTLLHYIFVASGCRRRLYESHPQGPSQRIESSPTGRHPRGPPAPPPCSAHSPTPSSRDWQWYATPAPPRARGGLDSGTRPYPLVEVQQHQQGASSLPAYREVAGLAEVPPAS